MEELLKFKEEVHNMETADILLILEDQLDLYSEEEIQILKEEFSHQALISQHHKRELLLNVQRKLRNRKKSSEKKR